MHTYSSLRRIEHFKHIVLIALLCIISISKASYSTPSLTKLPQEEGVLVVFKSTINSCVDNGYLFVADTLETNFSSDTSIEIYHNSSLSDSVIDENANRSLSGIRAVDMLVEENSYSTIASSLVIDAHDIYCFLLTDEPEVHPDPIYCNYGKVLDETYNFFLVETPYKHYYNKTDYELQDLYFDFEGPCFGFCVLENGMVCTSNDIYYGELTIREVENTRRASAPIAVGKILYKYNSDSKCDVSSIERKDEKRAIVCINSAAENRFGIVEVQQSKTGFVCNESWFDRSISSYGSNIDLAINRDKTAICTVDGNDLGQVNVYYAQLEDLQDGHWWDTSTISASNCPQMKNMDLYRLINPNIEVINNSIIVVLPCFVNMESVKKPALACLLNSFECDQDWEVTLLFSDHEEIFLSQGLDTIEWPNSFLTVSFRSGSPSERFTENRWLGPFE